MLHFVVIYWHCSHCDNARGLGSAISSIGSGRGQLDHMQTICTSLQTDNHTNTSSLNFYRPDDLPDAQPTVSTH